KRVPSWLVLCGLTALVALGMAAVPAPTVQPPEKKEQPADQKADDKQPAVTPEGTLPADWVQALSWRSIGPASMSGRITAIAVSETDPSTYWIATASGGLLKTSNNGITFEHQFDHEATVSIGDVAV